MAHQLRHITTLEIHPVNVPILRTGLVCHELVAEWPKLQGMVLRMVSTCYKPLLKSRLELPGGWCQGGDQCCGLSYRPTWKTLGYWARRAMLDNH